MRPDELDEILAQTLDDGRLSRSERTALRGRLEDAGLNANQLAALRARVFDAARERLSRRADRQLIDWLEDLVKALDVRGGASTHAAEALFSPGDVCRNRIVGLLHSTRRVADICVYTITDDPITRAVLGAHERGVAVRIITDDRKSGDLGSDIDRLRRAGIPVGVDESDKHMHHKFAVFDEERVLTGSYNWTRSACTDNEENIVVSEHPRLIEAFCEEFESLWTLYGVSSTVERS